MDARTWLDYFTEEGFAQNCSAMAEGFKLAESKCLLIGHVEDCSTMDNANGTFL